MKGCAVGPGTDELGSQQLVAPGVERRCGGELGPEGRDILVELSVDEKRPVGRESIGRRRTGFDVFLVGIAEDELPRANRPPLFVAQRRAVARQGGQASALDVGLGEPVRIAEVLAVFGEGLANLVVDDGQATSALNALPYTLVVCGERLLVSRRDHHEYMDVGSPERRVPIGRRAAAFIAE